MEEGKELEKEIIGFAKMQQQKFNMLINKQDTEEAKVDEETKTHVVHNTNFIASKNLWAHLDKTPNNKAQLLFPKMLICSNERTFITTNYFIQFKGYITACNTSKKVSSFNYEMPFIKFLSQGLLHSLTITPVKMISCGHCFCVVLTEDGNVATWGYGANGCLGQGNYVSYTSPKIVQGIEAKTIYIEAGGFHTAALTEKGNLYMWGRNDEGQLSVEMGVAEQDKYGYLLTTPTIVLGDVEQVSLGEAHTIVLLKRDVCALCGRLVRSSKSCMWKQFNIGEQIVEISSSENYSLIVSVSGNVYSIGKCIEGQMTQLIGKDKSILVGKSYFPEPIISAVCGSEESLALGKSLDIYTWGSKGIYKLGMYDSLMFIKDKELMPKYDFDIVRK
jgi:alpha-tubulin suppressor-like RCC1 family protein